MFSTVCLETTRNIQSHVYSDLERYAKYSNNASTLGTIVKIGHHYRGKSKSFHYLDIAWHVTTLN